MLLLLFALFFPAFLVHQFYWRRKNLPPGPLPFPLVGNLLTLSKYNRWEDKLLEWKQEYGPIYTYWMGTLPIVSVNSYEKCVEMFVKDGDSYLEHMQLALIHEELDSKPEELGVFEANGSSWLEQRRFSLRVFRDFGLGKNKMQDQILEELETLFDHLNNDIKMGFQDHDFHMISGNFSFIRQSFLRHSFLRHFIFLNLTVEHGKPHFYIDFLIVEYGKQTIMDFFNC